MSDHAISREEVEAAIAARRELGEELEPAVVDAFVERIEARLATRRDESERALWRRRNHQKEMILGGMGISVPMLLIAAVFTGLAGVIAVCVALVALAILVMRDDG
jgi:VIT1/CCC1 family predicted Fe2+/Mn2+ transporter